MTKKIEQFIKSMEEAIPMLEAVSGFKMDYTPQSLQKMETALMEMYGGRGTTNEVIAILGVYLGETMRKNIKGAEWVDFEKYVFDAHLSIPSKTEGANFIVKPLIRVEKFVKDPTDTIYGFYAMAQDMAQGRLKPEVGSGQSPHGYSYKMYEVPEDLRERVKRGEITEDEMVEIVKKQQEGK